MSLGDILDETGSWLKRLGDAVAPLTMPTSAAGVQSAADIGVQKVNADATGQPFNELQSVVDTVFKPVGVALEPASKLPGWDAVMHFMASADQGINTALVSTQHAYAQNDAFDAKFWAEFTNSDTWSQAWKQSDFTNPNRVTSGQIITSGFDEQGKKADPFTTEGAKVIQAAATDSWVGRSVTTSVDLATSFVAPPGMGALAKGRLAAGVRTSTEAENIAARVGEVGVDLPGTAFTKAKATTKRYMTPNGSQNVDAQIARMRDGLNRFDGKTDQWNVFDEMTTIMEDAPPGEVAHMANIFTTIEKTVADPAVRRELRVNAVLANMGSDTAKAAIIRDAPLVGENIRNLTTNPREWAMWDDLQSMKLEAAKNALDNGTSVVDELPINEIASKHFDTVEGRSIRDAAKANVEARRAAHRESVDLDRQIREMKPRVQKTDMAEHVKAQRAKAAQEVKDLTSELQKAKADLHGTRRWVAGQVKATTKAAEGTDLTSGIGRKDFQQGPLAQHGDLNQALGDARRRVEDLQSQLDAAKSDRQLLDQTPLHDPQELSAWLDSSAEAKKLRQEAKDSLDGAFADYKQARDHLTALEKQKADAITRLDAGDRFLDSVLNVADPQHASVMRDAQPTVLGRVKEHLRDTFGDGTYVVNGDGNRIMHAVTLPSRAAKRALAPAARGHIDLVDLGLGARQMDDVLRRSKVYTRDEIHAFRNEFVSAREADRVHVVEKQVEETQKRIAYRFFQKEFPEFTPEDALKYADQVTKLTRKAFGKGSEWVSKAVDEAPPNDPTVIVQMIEGPDQVFNLPTLRSQLADAAPVMDPEQFHALLVREQGGIRASIAGTGNAITHAHDLMVGAWKIGALFRPGLLTRSMIDTYPRAMASMSAAEHMTAAINGAVNHVHNRGLRGLARIGATNMTPAEIAARDLYFAQKVKKVKGQTFQRATDVQMQGGQQMAATRGNTVRGAFFDPAAEMVDGLAVDRASWKLRAPGDPHWHLGYTEYAQQLLASPTARMVADKLVKVADGTENISELLREIKRSSEFRNEYRAAGRGFDMTPDQWLKQVIREVSNVFPDEEILAAAKNKSLSKKMVLGKFPRSEQFHIPAPEMRATEAAKALQPLKKLVDRGFANLLDKPDMWLAREPVMTTVANRTFTREIKALMDEKGAGYKPSEAELAKIRSKARNTGIGYVRRTFFDTTRFTNLHRAVTRFSPFFAAWEDAMISWGRLIYDDPRRLVKLSAAYHAPYTVQASNPDSRSSSTTTARSLTRGQESDGVYVVLPAVIADRFGVDQYRMRIDSINSIAQGETWWLPGVGPTVAAAAAYVLGSDKIISREAALDLVNTDSEMGKAVLKSVFLGGEVPPADPASLASQGLPGWVRGAFTDAAGPGKVRQRQTNWNYRVAQAIANGEELNADRYAELWDEADRSANAAVVLRTAMTAGFGFSGTAAVDGQFYADQMHIIQGMTPEELGGKTPEEVFNEKFPEAADLDWSITKNKTGINATVNASKAEAGYAPLLRKNPQDIGWMILGADNVVDPTQKYGDWSRTAYNIQKAEGARVYQDPAEAQADAQASVGWRMYNGALQQIEDKLVAQGADPKTVRASKEFRGMKSIVREQIAYDNPAFLADVTQFSDSFEKYYTNAKRLATDSPLKGRSDMVAFRDYDQARQQVMQMFGIQSLDGTTQSYVDAKGILLLVGQQLAANDTGFEQMWNRFLEREVE